MKPEDLAGIPPARLPFAITRAVSPAVRAVTPEASALDSPPTMTGHFSMFNNWYEVDSMFEGHFLERIAPGAFKKTIRESKAQMKVLFNHGQDPQMGDMILGSIADLREDEQGAAYIVPLFEGVPPLLVSGLRAGAYGSSFRFKVEKDQWDQSPEASDHNPQGIPERTITETRVMEFGPVTFPANPEADASARSTTDAFYARMRDAESLDALVRSAQLARTPVTGAATPSIEPPTVTPPVEPTASDTPRTVDPVTTTTPKETRSVSDYITRDEKAARVTELRDQLSRLAVEFPGVLPEQEQRTWDTDSTELDVLERDIAAWDTRQAKLAEFVSRAQNVETPIRTAPNVIRSSGDIYDLAELRSRSRTDEEFRQGLRDNAMRSVETSSFPNPNVAKSDAQNQAANLLDRKDTPDRQLAQRFIQTGSPIYQRAFSKKATNQHLTAEEERAAAIAVVGTTTTGGYAVPYVFDPTIIHTGAYTNINPYRTVCRVEQIVGGNVWRGVSAGAVAAQYRAEGAAMTEGGPTLALPTFTAQRADAFITLSREALQDRPDFASELSLLIDEGKATNEETQFSIGVGTTVYPLGMFVKSTFTVKETITNDTFAVADLDATEAALPIRHRAEAVWMLSRGVIRIIQGWETAYGKLFNSTLGYPAVGNPALNPGGNTGLSLLGYPVWETPSAPVTVTTDDTIVGILVSPKNYIVVDRVGMEVEIVPNLFDATTGFPTGQRGLMAFWRNTAGPVNADAGRQININ